MNKLLFIFLFFLSLNQLYSQPGKVKNFFDDLIKNKTDLSQYVSPEAYEKSGRFGIKYKGVENKFLISYDIDELIKQRIAKGEISYEIKYELLNGGYSKGTFKIKDENYTKDFFFKDELLIPTSSYYTRNWNESESKYFRIYLSNPELFNDYSARQLDNFVDVILGLLKVDNSGRELLKKEKINYILCRDEKEIEEISGFNTRGIYILAYDEIITTYNCHFHEIAHLLINYRLKNLPLYTLPFLQEGFATAVGGRGGLGRNVLLDIGSFLQQSQFIPFNSIITKSEFLSEDASLTYPVSALYNLFLLEELGIESYLKLYLNYSGDADHVADLKLDSIKLPSIDKFNSYLENYKPQNGVFLDSSEKFETIFEGKALTIYESENFYKIKIQSNLLISTSDPLKNYKSKKFEEILLAIKYSGYKYLIKADLREINIYNLYTNILIASYSAGFTTENKGVPKENSYFIFYVRKEIFDEDFKKLIISVI